MSDLTLYFTMEPLAGDAAQAAEQAALEGDLRRIATVAGATVGPPKVRMTGLELLAGITLTAHVVHQAAAIVHDLAAIVHDLKAMIADVREMIGAGKAKSVRVPVAMVPKPIETLTDEDYQTMAKDILDAREAAPPA